jgi:hypothetical protein
MNEKRILIMTTFLRTAIVVALACVGAVAQTGVAG